MISETHLSPWQELGSLNWHSSSETQEAQRAGFNQKACSMVIGAPRAQIWSHLGFQMPGVLVSTDRVSEAHVAACKCGLSRRQPHSLPGAGLFFNVEFGALLEGIFPVFVFCKEGKVIRGGLSGEVV